MHIFRPEIGGRQSASSIKGRRVRKNKWGKDDPDAATFERDEQIKQALKIKDLNGRQERW